MAGAAQVMTLDQFSSWANAAGSRLQHLDMTVPLKQAAVAMAADTKENFAGSHDPMGKPWPPLQHPRRNSKGHDQILRDKGLLMASVTAGGTGHVETLTTTQLVWGTNLIYAATHQYGDPSRNIPQRQFLGWSPKLVQTVDRIFGQFLASQIFPGAGK